MQRRTKILSIVGGIVLLLIIVLPFLVNANTFRPTIESQLTQSLGRKVQLGDMSFSPFTGNLVAKNVSIADDPAFSSQPFLQAKVFKIGVELAALIFSRQLNITHFIAVEPDINLIHSAKGPWNYSTLGTQAAGANKSPARTQTQALPDLAVAKLAIENGRVTVTELPATGRPLIYDKVDLTASDFSLLKRFPFTVSAALPAGGEIKVNGQAGPVNARDSAHTPVEADLKLTHFDPVAAGILDKSAGVSTVADITAHIVSNGQTATTTGTLHADKLQLVRNGAPAPKPVDVDFDLSQNLDTHAGTVRKIAIKTGTVAAIATGTFQQSAQQTNLNLNLSGHNLSIDQLQTLLPALGIRLPSGSALNGGTLTTDLTIRGPSTDTVITGPVTVNNTRLAGFNLGSKLSAITALGGAKTGDTTEIQTLRLALQSSAAGVRTDNVYALLPALGTVTGNGSVSAAGALNYRLLLKPASGGVAGVATGLLGSLGGIAGGATKSAGTNGIPVSITGTTTNPVFTPDIKGIGGNLLQGQLTGQKSKLPAKNAISTLSGLLGKH